MFLIYKYAVLILKVVFLFLLLLVVVLSFSKFHKEIGSFYNDVSKTDSKTKLRNRFGRQALSLIKFSFFIYLLFMKLKIFINTRKL